MQHTPCPHALALRPCKVGLGGASSPLCGEEVSRDGSGGSWEPAVLQDPPRGWGARDSQGSVLPSAWLQPRPGHRWPHGGWQGGSWWGPSQEAGDSLPGPNTLRGTEGAPPSTRVWRGPPEQGCWCVGAAAQFILHWMWRQGAGSAPLGPQTSLAGYLHRGTRLSQQAFLRKREHGPAAGLGWAGPGLGRGLRAPAGDPAPAPGVCPSSPQQPWALGGGGGWQQSRGAEKSPFVHCLLPMLPEAPDSEQRFFPFASNKTQHSRPVGTRASSQPLSYRSPHRSGCHHRPRVPPGCVCGSPGPPHLRAGLHSEMGSFPQ
ncbi:uncharacterized protein LOC123610506 [Leopardus geoffroyi]|uniref:uncharacterized protein LOC123610506 n=1 Tax=Leopardus geoffroyi TaxID=46844 RepID=UPI001E261B09|nr:uncharacterized protein LOC123610506 [Leopardus geoffroyi]